MAKAKKTQAVGYQRAQWEKAFADYEKALARHKAQEAMTKALAYSALFLSLIAASLVVALLSSQ